VSARFLEKLGEKMGGPNAVRYEVPAEYARWRVHQGEETSARAHRDVGADFLPWRYLLAGIDDQWEPDLEALCRELARPEWLERTAVLMYAVEFVDWWLEPDDVGGQAVRRFLAAAAAGMERLPDGGISPPLEQLPPPPPYLDMLSETHYIMMLRSLTAAGEAAIERAIDAHLDAIFPAARLRRYRGRLLQMGYLSVQNNRPTLAGLIMTAAWALDPAARVAPRRHPFLRQMLRRTHEEADLNKGDIRIVDEDGESVRFDEEE
jgi:hypothetical protein